MAQRFSRRTFFAAAAATLATSGCAHRSTSLQREFSAAVAAIQARVGGRIGAFNTNLPGDPRDTTTPQAMAVSMEKVLVGEVLAAQSRLQLIAWMQQSTTGNGRNGAANNLLIAWPPGRSAVIAAVYMSESKQPVSALDEAHAQIGGLLAAAVARQ